MKQIQHAKLDAIQILRAIAVLAVVFWHSDAVIFSVKDRLDFTNFEFPGVSLFFAISGFIICYIGLADGMTVKKFIMRRVVRIVPIYWVFTIAIILLFVIKPSSAIAKQSSDLNTVIQSFLILPQAGFPVLGVGWTLEHEIIFYGLFAIMLSLRLQQKIFWLIGALGLVGMWCRWDGPIEFWDYHVFSLLHFQFLIGIFVYQYKLLWRAKTVFLPIILLIVAVALLSLTKWYKFVFPEGIGSIYIAGDISSFVDIFGTAISCGMLLVAALQLEGLGYFTSYLSKFLIKVGDASFTIYLSHQLFFVGFRQILSRYPDMPWFAAEGVRMATVLTVIIGAIWFYDHFEKPLLKALQKRVA